jgi:hypothetical protein
VELAAGCPYRHCGGIHSNRAAVAAVLVLRAEAARQVEPAIQLLQSLLQVASWSSVSMTGGGAPVIAIVGRRLAPMPSSSPGSLQSSAPSQGSCSALVTQGAQCGAWRRDAQHR